jgi:hypothetical protein
MNDDSINSTLAINGEAAVTRRKCDAAPLADRNCRGILQCHVETMSKAA